MSTPTNEFQNLWQTNSDNPTTSNTLQETILQQAKSPQQESARAQAFTLLVLTTVVVILLLFFHYLSPVEQTLSIVGKWFMIGSLLIRIVAEAVGLIYARKVDFFASASNFVKQSRRLVKYRAGIHHHFVVATFVVYSLGYYMIIPEWSLYFSKPMIWLLIVSYIIIMALVIMLSIRPGMKRERLALNELEKLAADLESA